MYYWDKNKRNLSGKPAQILSWLLAVLMALLPISSFAAFQDVSGTKTYYGADGYQNLYNYGNFADIGGSGNKEAIYEMAMMGIMGGFSDGTFKPGEAIKPSQAQIIMSRITGKANTTKPPAKEPAMTKGDFITLMDKTLKTKTDTQRMEGLTGAITREEVASMLNKNADKIQGIKGIGLIKGEIADIKNVDDAGKRSRAIYNRTPEGAYFNVVINGSQNFPLYRGGQLASSADSVYVGETLNYYIKDDKVIYAKVDQVQNVYTIEGKFEGIQGSNVVFRDPNNNLKIYPYAPAMQVYLNDTKLIPKEDLQYGQDILVSIKNNLVQSISAGLEQDPDRDGYIPPESKLVAGVVAKTGANSITLNEKGNFTVNSATVIVKDGKNSTINGIKEGDRVKLYFDNIYSKEVSKVEVEGLQRQVQDIVKATLDSYNQTTGEVVVKNPKTLNGWSWTSMDNEYGRYKVDGNIYYKGKLLTPSDLKSYKGTEIYMALAKGYGDGIILKANLKPDFGFTYDDNIREVSQSNGYIDVNNVIINYDEGTLLVKEGRLVGSSNLQRDIGAFVEGSIKPNKQANIIVMGKAQYKDNNEFTIYRGTLYDVFEYGIEIGRDSSDRRIYEFKNNTWSESGDRRIKVDISNDTRVYDSDNKKEITVEDLRKTRFEKENSELKNPYQDRQIYVVVKDGMAYGINFLKGPAMDQVKRQNLMYAKITEATETSMTLSEIREWNALSEKWVQEDEKETLNIGQAMIFDGEDYLAPKYYPDMVGKRVMILYEKKTSKTDDAIIVIGE